MKAQTTHELDQARKYYRKERIPKRALRVMDADTERLTAENFAGRALRAGAVAPDFNSTRRPWKARVVPVPVAKRACCCGFLSGRLVPYYNIHLRGFQRRIPELEALGAQIVAISPHLPDNSLRTQEKD